MTALGDPTRRAIFERLADRPSTVGELAAGLPVSRPAVSQHLRVLREAGMVVVRPAGTRRIYSVDPAGYRGLELYQQDPLKRAMRGPTVQRSGPPKMLRDFLEIMADNTGARAIVNTDSWTEVDAMLEEAASYYLVGYQTTNGAPDGKFRKVDVKVKRPGATIRTKNGFYAPKDGRLATAESRNAPTGVVLVTTVR